MRREEDRRTRRKTLRIRRKPATNSTHIVKFLVGYTSLRNKFSQDRAHGFLYFWYDSWFGKVTEAAFNHFIEKLLPA